MFPLFDQRKSGSGRVRSPPGWFFASVRFLVNVLSLRLCICAHTFMDDKIPNSKLGELARRISQTTTNVCAVLRGVLRRCRELQQQQSCRYRILHMLETSDPGVVMLRCAFSFSSIVVLFFWHMPDMPNHPHGSDRRRRSTWSDKRAHEYIVNYTES